MATDADDDDDDDDDGDDDDGDDDCDDGEHENDGTYHDTSQSDKCVEVLFFVLLRGLLLLSMAPPILSDGTVSGDAG